MKNLIEKIAEGLDKLRKKTPLVHHLTNHVVMSDCANITLHTGGAPVMTLAPEEAEEMVSLADALVINIGTLTNEYVEVMITAGKKAVEKGIPVLLDPVGAGATAIRTEACRRILREVNVDIVKGNAGEISVLAGVEATVRGVDSIGSSMEPSEVTQKLAGIYGNTAVVTGVDDWVSDTDRTFCVKNGHQMLSCLVGTGCMLGSVTAAFASAIEDSVVAAAGALAAYGISAELAAEKGGGPAAFKCALFDEVYSLTGDKIRQYARIEQTR